MVESNGGEHPASGRTEEGARGASIRFTGAWGIAAAFTVLLGILGVASWTTNETTKASKWVAHTYEVGGDLRKVLSVLQDAETGQRGYLLTGNDAYLEPFVLANDRIDDIVADLRVLTGDNPRQQKSIDRLEPLIADKLDELKQTISLRQAKRVDAALAIVRSDRGKLIMDRIRGLIAEMESEEAALLVLRQRDLEWVKTLSIFGEGIGIVFLIGIAAVVILKISRALTLRRRAEEALGESEEKNRRILESVGEGIYGLDMEGKTTFINPAAVAMIGWKPEDLIGKPQHDILHHTRPDGSPYPREESHIYAALKDGKVHNVTDEVFWRKDGTSFPVEYTSTPVLKGEKLVGVVVVFHDITERKQAEDKIKESLAEKEVLLREIHHRVKNNLQVISSMLSLQASTETDDRSIEALKESQRRVGVMARIHETLHQSNDLASIHARDYLTTLVEDTKASSGQNAQGISFSFSVDDIIFDVDHAIPCGQIISELLSNSLKHAFPKGQSGKIEVSLHRRDGGRIELAVADDGKGLPEGFDPQRSKTLGMRLVHALAMQLNGVIEVDGSGGTRVQITFPEKPS